MSPKLDQSINRIDNIVLRKLSKLKNSTTIDDLQTMNTYLSEMKTMKDTIRSISGQETEEPAACGASDNLELVELYLQGCEFIVQLYSIVDYEKMDQAGLNYLSEHLQEYLDVARCILGPQVPELPILYLEEHNGLSANDR